MADLLDVHRALLETWRTRTNLVGPGPLDAHYDDAREAFAGLRPEGRWADLGSGAGFPGIPFAAMFPTVAVDLVENRRLRVQFLEAVLEAAKDALVTRPAPLRVVAANLRTLPPGRYDGVMARALAPPDELLALVRPLLRPRGRVVMFLGGEAPTPAADGWVLEAETPYRIADKARRSLVMRRA